MSVLLLMAVTTSGMGQVLGGSSTYGFNSGLSIGVGTHATFGGRSFWKDDNVGYGMAVVEPERYQSRLVNPLFGIGWWSEYPNDDFMVGYQITGNYGVEKYQVGLGTENLTGSLKTIGVGLSCYVGWHFGSQLTAAVGIQEENRFPIRDGGRLNIFNSQSTVGFMAFVRYAFAEDYFVALNAGYGMFPLGDLDLDWEKYNPIGDEGYYVEETDLKTFTLMLGIGRGF